MPSARGLCSRALLLSCLVAALPVAGQAAVVDPLAFENTPGGQAIGIAPTPGRNGMVVVAQDLAAHVGADILARGGNAVDAAVAVGYAMAVVYPAAGNIGGGGFMTLRMPDGQATFVDFREHAPGAATATMYQDAAGHVIPNASTKGWKAVAVPGTVAGLEQVHDRWGKLSRADVMAPAITLARDGFILKPSDADLLHTSTAEFARIRMPAKSSCIPMARRSWRASGWCSLILPARSSGSRARGPAVFTRGRWRKRSSGAARRVAASCRARILPATTPA